jgi:hypothetical protein
MQGKAQLYGKINNFLVKNRQSPGKPHAGRAGVAVRFCAKFCGTTAKDFTICKQVGMNLKAHDTFKIIVIQSSLLFGILSIPT